MNPLTERVLSRLGRYKPTPPQPLEAPELAPKPALTALEIATPAPEPASLADQAREILAELRPAGQALTPAQWLELAEAARLEAVATFPPDRQAHALREYVAHNCAGRPAALIAAHAVALTLWARSGRAAPIGHYQDAACLACGLQRRSIPRDLALPLVR